MTKNPNSKQSNDIKSSCFGHWKLEFVIWCLGFVIFPINRIEITI